MHVNYLIIGLNKDYSITELYRTGNLQECKVQFNRVNLRLYI
jgi:hypothetical protein